jgi:hypothetical protein
MVMFMGAVYFLSCTKDNSVAPAPLNNNPIISRGNAILLPGDLVAKDTNSWKLDKVHSSVLWSTSYIGAAGLLTGRFNNFGMHEVVDAEKKTYDLALNVQPLKDKDWAFYESDPGKTFFNGYVQINTSNTGEPGRDTGCNITTLGTVKITPGKQNLTVGNLATIKVLPGAVSYDLLTADYICNVDLTWQGKLGAPVTKRVIGRLKYVKRQKVGVAPAQYDVFGLQLKFQMNSRDFGVTSTSIADKVDIECNMNFNNK